MSDKVHFYLMHNFLYYRINYILWDNKRQELFFKTRHIIYCILRSTPTIHTPMCPRKNNITALINNLIDSGRIPFPFIFRAL